MQSGDGQEPALARAGQASGTARGERRVPAAGPTSRTGCAAVARHRPREDTSMSAPMEELLRDTLAHRAAAPVLANPDPWEAFSGRERRHRTRRRTGRVVLGLVVGA